MKRINYKACSLMVGSLGRHVYACCFHTNGSFDTFRGATYVELSYQRCTPTPIFMMFEVSSDGPVDKV